MSIYSWGVGTHGCLGLGDERYGGSSEECACCKFLLIFHWRLTTTSFHIHKSRDKFVPTLLTTHPNDNPEWAQIVCGRCYTVALTKSGEVYTWGENSKGQLGHGDKESRDTPTKIECLVGVVITKVTCADFHTIALTDKGEVFTWYVYTSERDTPSCFIMLK